jgi:dienelactone hydrolase
MPHGGPPYSLSSRRTAYGVDHDSHPPVAPIAGGAVDGSFVELATSDGTRCAAYCAHASASTGAGMIVLPDVRGLAQFYEEPALDLAGAIGFYGWPVGPWRNDMPAPADVAASMRAPVLAIFGGDDQGIGPDKVATFRAALERAGSTTRSSRSRARHTPSSTGSRRHSRRPPPMRGLPSWRSSVSTRRRREIEAVPGHDASARPGRLR